MTDNELVFYWQGWPDPELDWSICSGRCWVMLPGTKTPGSIRDMGAGTSHPSHARGKGLGEGLAFLPCWTSSSSAEHCSECHQWAKAGWKIPGAGTDTEMLQSGGQGGFWDPGVRLVPPNVSVAWPLMLIQAKKVVQELCPLFQCPAPGGSCSHATHPFTDRQN